eukprot:scaffold34606_cov192-Amphora_coffeaeformis.AAC.11
MGDDERFGRREKPTMRSSDESAAAEAHIRTRHGDASVRAGMVASENCMLQYSPQTTPDTYIEADVVKLAKEATIHAMLNEYRISGG